MPNKSRSKAVPLRLNERVGYRFSLITKRLNQKLATVHSRQFGISVNNWKIMSVIAFFGPLSGTELGTRTSLDADKISRSIDNLVHQGYVVRKHSEVDRRKIILSLSSSGQRVHDKVEAAASSLETGFLSVLIAQERRALHAILAKLEDYSTLYFSQIAPAKRRSIASPRTDQAERSKIDRATMRGKNGAAANVHKKQKA
jgi:DNA-binding MarR family transcriptional regulator